MSATASPIDVQVSPTPKLTTRRRLLLSGLVDGKSVAAASRSAGFISRQSGHDAFQQMREQLPELMRKIGLDEHAVLGRIRDKMDATKVVTASFNGEITDALEVPDNQAQMHAIELAADLLGLKPRDDRTSIGSINIVWGGAAPAWAMSRLSRPAPASERKRKLTDRIGNDSVTDCVPQCNANSTIDMAPPRSAIEGTGSDEGGSAHTHPAKKPRKKSGPRLPVYKGRARRD